MYKRQTQRSRTDLTELTLLPVSPGVLDAHSLGQALEHWRRLRVSGEMALALEQELGDRLERSESFIWPGLFYPDAASLDVFLPQDAVYILGSAPELRNRLADQHAGWRSFLEREASESGWRWPLHALCWPEESARKTWQGKRQVVFEDLVMGQEKHGVDLPEKSRQSFQDLFWRPESARRPWTALTTALKEWSASDAQVLLSFHTERSRRKFLGLAEQEGLRVGTGYQPGKRGVAALLSPLKAGMERCV